MIPITVIAALLALTPAAQQQSATPAPLQFEPGPDFRQFHKTLAWNFTHGLFSADNIPVLVIGSAATVGAVPFDEDLSDGLRDELDALGETGNIIGSPVTIAASTGALVLVSAFTDNQKFRSFAYTLAQAQVLDSAFKYTLKSSIDRERPSGENNNSFPSGHASGTFTFATVVHHYYGNKAGIAAYAVAGLVAASRIEKGKHYLSDVAFGATLGYLAGSVAIRGTEGHVEGRRVTIVPVVGARQRGIRVLLEF